MNEMPNETQKTNDKKKKAAPFLVRLLQGSLVGVGGVLPGISGGVLCAIFGLYEPLMELLAHPIKNFKKHWKLLLPVVIGIALGFLGLAKLVVLLFQSNEDVAACLFVGLILGMLPSLWKEAGGYGRKKASFVTMGIAFALIFGILMTLTFATEVKVTPNLFWYFLSGVFWGLGVIVPGMSASSPLLFLGLYEPLMSVVTGAVEAALAFVSGKMPFTEALAAMQFGVILPFAFGLLATVLGLARPVNYFLKKYPSQMYHAIFGIVAAMTLPIIPYRFTSAPDLLIKLACLVGGFAAAWGLDKISRKYA
ncbi:MAG: DUF368 domain-containing protein [Ruminococcaceae bacterium]|nr:DUF368 domain-containing protein [Oscillospiraceae bacterium]